MTEQHAVVVAVDEDLLSTSPQQNLARTTNIQDDEKRKAHSPNLEVHQHSTGFSLIGREPQDTDANKAAPPTQDAAPHPFTNASAHSANRRRSSILQHMEGSQDTPEMAQLQSKHMRDLVMQRHLSRHRPTTREMRDQKAMAQRVNVS